MEANYFNLIGAVILVVISIYMIKQIGLLLADKHGRDVRVVWYLLSLTVLVTCLIAIWASSVGAIDSKGFFQGELGEVINKILHFMLDLKTDFIIFVVILSIILIPQFTSYILSGLFGCASQPILVGETVGFFVWGVVKSMAVVSGIFLSVAIYGLFNNWEGWNLTGVASMISLPFMLIALSFSILYVYRDIDSEYKKKIGEKFPGLVDFMRKKHEWLSRKNFCSSNPIEERE